MRYFITLIACSSIFAFTVDNSTDNHFTMTIENNCNPLDILSDKVEINPLSKVDINIDKKSVGNNVCLVFKETNSSEFFASPINEYNECYVNIIEQVTGPTLDLSSTCNRQPS